MKTSIYENMLALYQDYALNCQELLEDTSVFTQQFSPETKAEDLNNFIQRREEHISKLQKARLQIEDIGKSNRIILSRQEQETLDQETSALKTIVAEIIKQDEMIRTELNMDLERIKLELQRLQSVKRVTKLYRGSTVKEARFIDKNR